MLGIVTTCNVLDFMDHQVGVHKDVISNGDGSYRSNKQIYGNGVGPLALTPEEKKDFEKSGWHDTGLINDHGQPIVQNDKGEMLSVCRMQKVRAYC